ncbi:F-box/WD repeat-containing protein 12 isoform X1 [Triplophysa dalaica]|uniref:F-box/WD repeat-containing protein 12 isoform X1 n=1 Tax=Triplophysa dalaica TaxID=1582913 RepID=UPI0024DF71FF|nr:F-box/WD repeat-containing protein 12 isoform X1 [Triplophysa dalaica]
METGRSLPLDCLIGVFSLLQDEDLIRVSTVCKEWYHAAETPWLWRRMCLQRWSFCNVSELLSDTGTHSWKGYYLRRFHLEMKMKSGTSCDYTCKSLRGHKGKVIGFAYLAGNNSCSDVWKSVPIVCSASTDGTVKAWDIQEGVYLWSSPVQSPLQNIIVDPVQYVVVTSDSTGTIKTWNGSTGEEVASFETGLSKITLLLFNDKSSAFLMVGSIQGLLVLTCPALSEVSRHPIFDSFWANLLLSSPDKKWILATSKENNDLSPKVFYSETLRNPVENEESLCQSLPVTGCCAAVFLPSLNARVAVIHTDGLFSNKTISVFDLTIKETKYIKKPEAQQVASFQLKLCHRSDLILEARGSNNLLVVEGNYLKVYTLKGELVANFEDHIQPITALCVDSFRVVTASRDLSLRVLTWRNDKQHGLSLESQYHLLGGSHTRSRGFTNVACDYASIVASVDSVDGNDVLKAYTFHF